MQSCIYAQNGLSVFGVYTLSLIVHMVSASSCPHPTLINAEVDTTKFSKEQLSTRYKIGTTFYYRCQDGYHFKKNAVRHKLRCNEQGEWEPKPIMLCYDSCNNECASHASCVGGKCHCDSNHTGPYCRTRLCQVPKHFLHGHARVIGSETIDGSDFVKEGTRITFICNSGYSITRGSLLHTCTHDGWDWLTQPVCERNTCSRKPFYHGSPVPDQSQYFAGSRIEFQCYPGYRLLGRSTLFCTSDGIWSDSWPMCVEQTCPIVLLPHGIIDPPNVGQSGRYPVNKALRLNCMKGYTYIGESQNIRCQGPPQVKWSSEPGECITNRQFSIRCNQEGKVMKIENGKKICAFMSKENSGYVKTTASAVKKTEKPLTIVTSTAGGLLLLLLVVITLVAYQRRRNARNQRGRSGRQRLSGDDDRLSFVYYSNDVHVVLPSYDEAMQARRINNPPPYLPVEDANRRDGADAAITPVAPTTTTTSVNEGGPGNNLYETIDEIRSTVNAVRASLTSSSRSLSNRTAENIENTAVTEDTNNTSTSNLQGAESVSNPPTGHQHSESNKEVEEEPQLRFDLYDGPNEEPIYASVQRILSHSLVLANGGTDKPAPEAPAAPDVNVQEVDDVADTISLSSNDYDDINSDTEPLL